MSLYPSITHWWCCIETAEQPELISGIEAILFSPTLCLTAIQVSPENKVTLLGIFFYQTLYVEKIFCHNPLTIKCCHLISIDTRLSHWSPHLCTAQWVTFVYSTMGHECDTVHHVDWSMITKTLVFRPLSHWKFILKFCFKIKLSKFFSQKWAHSHWK